MDIPWDQPVPEELWAKVAEYCDDDVLATEAVFNHLSADFTARLILADLADGIPNDTTNTLTGKIIFGVGCGLLTMIIRLYASYPEGVSFAILIMNILTPHIDNLTIPALNGVPKEKKGGDK
mgnify:CR=1 FL=1